MTYQEFIASKVRRWDSDGMVPSDMERYGLFDFQNHVAKWAIEKGRACIFAGTGLGKTRMQVAFADHVARDAGTALIVCPLAVADQTIREASQMGVSINRVSDGGLRDGINITNYHRLQNISDNPGGIILDESSILKSHEGSFREYITSRFRGCRYKLALTATPAPNDYMEIGTHSEFIGSMSRVEMLAEFFTHDGKDTSKWRLKKHGRRDFWKWLSSWAICFSCPSDIGFDGSNFVLPELTITEHVLPSDGSFGGLFGGVGGINATTIHSVMKGSLDERIARVAECAKRGDGPLIIWCSTNDEQCAIEKLFPKAASVKGSDTIEKKESFMTGFSNGEYDVMITKPSIAGFGMNWQHCNRMIFSSVSYSYEQFFQAVRRCYRFGQKRPVVVDVIYTDTEKAVRDVVSLKSVAHEQMILEMKRYAQGEDKKTA